MTVSQLLKNMSSTEFLYWMEFNELEITESKSEKRSREMLDKMKEGD